LGVFCFHFSRLCSRWHCLGVLKFFGHTYLKKR
jgi:hypothetical protein